MEVFRVVRIMCIMSIIATFMHVSVLFSQPETSARQLNAQGYELYKQGKYEEALVFFEKACNADTALDLAYYNYACTLGVLMKKDYPEWYEHKSTAFEYLKKAITINRSVIKKIKKDPDLEVLRQEFEYYRVIGLTTTKTSDVRTIMTSLTWYIHGQGVLAYIGGLKFFPDGTFKLWYHSTEFFENFESNDNYIYTGKFSINHSKIRFEFDKPMLRKRSIEDIYSNKSILESNTVLHGLLHTDGRLIIDGFEYTFFSWFDEFSA